MDSTFPPQLVKDINAMQQFAQMEEHYYEITELYDLAEELVETVEHELVSNPAEQLAIVEPLIDEIGEAADVLCEEFILIAEHQGKPVNKKRIEAALRRIYSAIDAYNARVQASVQDAKLGLRNLADPIVKRITRQMEVIVATLIDFVELSLNRIMSAVHAEELKQRQEKIAIMLHQIGQSAS